MELHDWITTQEAARLSGYSAKYVRLLVNRGLIEAQKKGRDWLIHRESILAYKERMVALGNQRFNPWRPELVEGRRKRTEQEVSNANGY